MGLFPDPETPILVFVRITMDFQRELGGRGVACEFVVLLCHSLDVYGTTVGA